MDTNLLTNKIVSIIIALVVVLCVLVPITSNYGGGNGNGGGSNLQELAYYAEENPQENPYLYSDSSHSYYNDIIISDDGEDTNVRFIPNHDGRTYKEGEIVAILFNQSDNTLMITYTNNAFKVSGTENGQYIEDFTINGFVIGTEYLTYNSGYNFVQYLDSINDTTFKTSDTSDFDFKTGYVKTNNSSALTVYITKDPSVSIKVEDAEPYYHQSPVYPTSYLVKMTVSYGGESMEMNVFAPSTYDEAGGEYIDVGDISNVVPDFDEKRKSPITLDKWDILIEIDTGDMISKYRIEPQYLIFDSRIPFESSGSSGNGGDNGTIGTLISMIPIFVTLALLGAVVGMFMNKRNLI